MGLVILAFLFLLLLVAIYISVPYLAQIAVDHIGREKQPRPPIVRLVKVNHFDTNGVTVSLDLLLPLPVHLPLPEWFSCGVANKPTVSLTWLAAMNSTQIISVLLDNPITLSGDFDAIHLDQSNIRLTFTDVQALQRLVRRISLQLKSNASIDAVDVRIETSVDIQVMGVMLWTNVTLHKHLDVAPIIETIRKDPMFTESHKNPQSLIPPPVFLPDHLGLDSFHSSYSSLASSSTEDINTFSSSTKTVESAPGPLHLYNVGRQMALSNLDTNQDPPTSRIGFEGLLPGLKLNTLPQTTTPQGSVKSGIRVSFSATPALQVRIHHIEFNVKMNGEFVAHGMVGEVFLGSVLGGARKRWTDIVVEITPSIIKGGRSGLVKNAIGGARGFLKGFIAGALSGLNGGDFGDGSTVFEIVDLNVYAENESGDVINVEWIRDIVQVVDMLVDVNPIKAIGNNVDTSIVVEVAASFMLARGCSIM
ncbi:UNVERIFIED_CONTAM: hypothetical protein HDU68_009584 [Siphonaria sp. JEL0065]|nr:hypothetical protein HDU68_009584 [Siphonaria sp. JEL0065]